MRMIRLKTIAIAAGLALAGAAPAVAQQAANVASTPAAAPAAPAADQSTSPLLAQDGAPAMAVTPGVGQPTSRSIKLQPQFTPDGVRAAKMNDYILTPIIIAISALVMILLAWCIIFYRRGANPTPSRTSHNTVLEFLWTLGPVLILVGIAIPSIGLLQAQFRPAPDNAVTLKATGNQWYWTYEYPGLGDIQITANILKEKDEVPAGERFRTDADGPKLLAVDNRVVLPVGVPIKLETTASDVIHSWAVPAFWIKLDAVPGRINETTFTISKPGLYFGQCSELCGANHGFMPIVVEAVPPAQFAAWVRAKGGKMPGEAAAEPAVASAATPAVATTIDPAAPSSAQPDAATAPAADNSEI